MAINDAVANLAYQPFSPEINFWVAREYDSLGQTAAAISFYLRTAEYGYETYPLHAYTALLKMAKCFEAQNDRELTVSGALLQALALLPDRPEAYFLMAQFFEKTRQWQEAYTWTMLGKNKENVVSLMPLPAYVGYDFKHSLDFQEAVASYWVGRSSKSLENFKTILDEATILDKYREAVNYNLEQINVTL